MHITIKNTQILHIFFLAISLLTALMVLSPSTLAVGACGGSNAPDTYDCGKIALGCPGSTQQGPVAADTLKCQYGPSDNTYKCPATQCTFADKTMTLKLGQSIPGPNTSSTTSSTYLEGDCSQGLQKCSIISKYLNPLIRFLSALVGVAVVISIIIGGIQYASSAGDPQAVSAAKTRIRNAIIALVAFIFLFALLNFLIPGGLT